MKKSEIVRNAVKYIKDDVITYSCNAIGYACDDAKIPSWEVQDTYVQYVRNVFGLPEWWGKNNSYNEDNKTQRVTFLESFATCLENIGE